jgi:hypothetical protein
LTKTTSAFSITFETCGGGSNVWLFVPSGTTPEIDALSPAMFATIEVIGATVVTTLSFPADGSPGSAWSPPPQPAVSSEQVRASVAAAGRRITGTPANYVQLRASCDWTRCRPASAVSRTGKAAYVPAATRTEAPRSSRDRFSTATS